MTSVTVTDTQISADEYSLTAAVPVAKYTEICTTLGCEAGQVAQTLLQRVSDETDARHMSIILMLLREVKTAGKLGTLATMLSDGGTLANLRQP